MASNKLRPSYILAYVLFLFIYQAAGHFGTQRHHDNRRDPRHLRGPPSNCFRRPNCGINFAGGIILDQINVFEVDGRSDAIFQIDIGKNFTALNVAFEADHEDVTASIVLTKVFPPRQEGGLRTSYDNRSTSWQIRISDEIIRSHCDETAFIRIDNRHRFKAVVKLTLSFELPPEGKYAMIIALSATGGAIVLVVLAFAIICYLRKKRRRMIQVDFPILSSGSQPQTNTVHAVNAPNSFQQIDAQQRRLIQQQLILQQQLLLLQQQHLQLRESHQFSNPHSPSGDFNHQLHQHQHQHQERDEGQQHQDMTVEKLDVRFPETFYEYIDTPLSQTICSICLEEMRTRTVCRQLDCNHVFHSECIKLWLVNKIVKSQSIACPNCNRGICDAPPETAVTKNNELHDSHVVLMIPDNAFE